MFGNLNVYGYDYVFNFIVLSIITIVVFSAMGIYLYYDKKPTKYQKYGHVIEQMKSERLAEQLKEQMKVEMEFANRLCCGLKLFTEDKYCSNCGSKA